MAVRKVKERLGNSVSRLSKLKIDPGRLHSKCGVLKSNRLLERLLPGKECYSSNRLPAPAVIYAEGCPSCGLGLSGWDSDDR